MLIAHISETGYHQDILAYPYLMCWRHYVELQLKAIIMLLEQHTGRPPQVQRSQKIALLRRTARGLSREAGYRAADGEDALALADVDRVLRQLDELDPSSEHFRYPVLGSGDPTLPGIERLHLRRFHEAMAGVAALLDAMDTTLRLDLDARIEMMAAFAAKLPDDVYGAP